jgi:hypothetical protein
VENQRISATTALFSTSRNASKTSITGFTSALPTGRPPTIAMAII